MHGFCGDDKECMGFVAMIKNAWVWGDDKERVGFVVSLSNVSFF